MAKYFVFDVGLIDIQPRIWRRFMIAQRASFGDLHRAIQDSFGWQDCHAWEFRLPNGDPIAGLMDGVGQDPPTDGEHLRLTQYFSGEGVCEWCEYCYDFSVDWVHEVKLVDLAVQDESFERRLLGGVRSCPPEDCGGPAGYAELVDSLRAGRGLPALDPQGAKRWASWDPEAFDVARVAGAFDRGRDAPAD